MTRKGIGGHQSAAARTVTWLTPPHVLAALGGAESFDLDPCAAPDPRPWPTARRMICEPDDGLGIEWEGRVWLNPPYTSGEVDRWLERLADHGDGAALIFARTETECFQRHVWQRAHGLLFLFGRLHFHDAQGRRAGANAGAPSVLAAYGSDEMDRLASCDLPGAFTPLRLARFVLVAGAPGSWRDLVLAYVRRQGRAPISVSDLYRHFARHPKARANPNWRAKVRQTVQRAGLESLGGGLWREAAT